MTNPVLNKQRIFTQQTPAGYPQMPGYQVGGQGRGNAAQNGSQYGFSHPIEDNSSFEGATYPPVGTSPSQGEYLSEARMTLDDVLIKTALSFGVLLLTGAFAWFFATTNPAMAVGLMLVGFLGGFVVAMINTFKRVVSPMLVLVYAALEGLGLGAVSALMESFAPGVVSRAVLATVVTFAVMLTLYKTRIVRFSDKLMKILIIGMVSIVAFSLINMLFSMFGGASAAPGNMTIAGFPLWVIVSVIAVILAALSLVTDFHMVETAVQNGAPRSFSWYCAFGLMVTLVWLYMEFLRLFAYFSQD